MYTPTDTMTSRVTRHSQHDLPVVYLAEDEPDIREALTSLLTHEGFVVRAALDGMQLFDWLFRNRGWEARLPDVIITDHRMPGYSSLDILDCLTEVHWTIPVIVLTAFGSEVRSLAKAHGAAVVLDKPFDPAELCTTTMTYVNWDVRQLRGSNSNPTQTRRRSAT